MKFYGDHYSMAIYFPYFMEYFTQASKIFVFQVKCKGNVTSFGRRRRSTVVPTVTEANVTELTKVPKNQTTDELPLQTQIIVKDDRPDQDIQPNPLRSKDTPDTLLILGSGMT